MLKTPDWAVGATYLREHAPELIPLIDRFPVCELKPEPENKYFGTLVTGIVSQQLPPDVSLQLLKKLGELLGNPLTPQAVMNVSVEALCEQGLVKQKAEYLKSFGRSGSFGQHYDRAICGNDRYRNNQTISAGARTRAMDHRNVFAVGFVSD